MAVTASRKRRRKESERLSEVEVGEGSGCLGQAVMGGSYQTVIYGYLQYFTLL